MSAPLSSTAWPEDVWLHPVFCDIDERGRREIREVGSAFDLPPHSTVFAEGDPADTMFVVLSGAVKLSARSAGSGERHVRTVRRGEIFGEESIVGAHVRAWDAASVDAAHVASVPAHLFRRVVGRLGGASRAAETLFARHERTLARAAAEDVLLQNSVTGLLRPEELGVVLDALHHVHLSLGDTLCREGEPAQSVYLVAQGFFELRAGGKVVRTVATGDLVGEDVLGRRSDAPIFAATAIALGPSWVLALPTKVFESSVWRPEVYERLSRLRRERAAAARKLQVSDGLGDPLRDPNRLAMARSMLAIDLDRCTRCGHCAWSCGEVHDDGLARLVRTGNVVHLPIAANAGVQPQQTKSPETVRVLLAVACQHCEVPACLPACPTAAIRRDERGVVHLRAEACTGCGACTKACPWDALAMAARGPHGDGRGGLSSEVAVKCDLCAGLAEPQCVSSCPTGALLRLDPLSESAKLAEALGRSTRAPREINGRTLAASPRRLDRSRARWGVGIAATGAVGFLALDAPGGRTAKLGSGAAAGVLFLLLLSYAVFKRASRRPGRWGFLLLQRVRSNIPASAARLGHIGLGLAFIGVALWHVRGASLWGAGGALGLIALGLVVTGLFEVAAQALVPVRLTSLEREAFVPEEAELRADELDRRIFRLLSGQSDFVKRVFEDALAPYRAAWAGGLALSISGRSLATERERVTRTVRETARVLERLRGGPRDGDRPAESVAGELAPLVDLLVERRALLASRLLYTVLRAGSLPHAVLASSAVVALVVHVATVWGGR